MIPQLPPQSQSAARPAAVTLEAVLAQERDAISDFDGSGLTALCLSGGGIRSAAFCLGCVQALARQGLLRRFSYLSTVSGGGYIGGWLTRLIADADGDVAAVEQQLARPEPGCDPVDRLRRYVNYLTPEPGMFSSDTWQGVILWLRNTAINWSFFAPLMLALAVAALLYVGVVWWNAERDQGLLPAGLAVCGAIYTLGLYFICTGLPSHSHPDCPAGSGALGPDSRAVGRRIVLPTLIWGLALPVFEAPCLALSGAEHGFHTVFAPPWAEVAPPGERTLYSEDDFAIVMRTAPAPAAPRPAPPPSRTAASMALFAPAICVFAGSIVAYLAAWWRCVRGCGRWRARLQGAVFARNLVAWVGSSLVSAALLLLGARLATRLDLLTFALAAPFWVVASDMFRMTLYVAFRRYGLRSDLDREWLARLSADRLKIAIAVVVLGVSAVLVPVELRRHGTTWWIWVLGVVGLVPGPASAMLGRSVLTSVVSEARRPGTHRIERLAKFAASIFIFSLLVVCGWLVASALGALLRPHGPRWMAIAWLGGMLLGLVVLIVVFDRCIDFNLFSMHASYRNRLIRAFLGTAIRPGRRHPDAYTSFAAHDNIRMQDCFAGRGVTPAADQRVLYPVFGLALNRTSGDDTALAQRKAAPFTITPHYCGSSLLGRYLPTSGYYQTREKLSGPAESARGITLGTAMALSGAAVSPNMGYASSPLLALVMTLFNARLGAWYPNPACTQPPGALMRWLARHLPADLLRHSGAAGLYRELRGQSDDTKPLVYLSDGGHFDALGLYEMLRRRCRLILVVDALHDEAYDCAELGRTLEHAHVDLRVRVEFGDTLRLGDAKTTSRLARAAISYPEDRARGLPAQSGHLLHIKPWVPDDAPAQIRTYDRLHPEFPHRPSLDQFFEESDFENYRMLGEHLVRHLPSRRFVRHAQSLADLIF